MKIVHMSHHAGCQRDLAYVASKLGHEVDFLSFPYGYNVSRERANRFWNEQKDILRKADIVLTSDTAPLSRVVLQNLEDFPGRLVVWVCNRFDYCDQATNDCGFPDPEFYSIFRRACSHEKVLVVPYTDFEYIYARKFRGIPMPSGTIRPTGATLPPGDDWKSLIPEHVDKSLTFLIPPYHNDTHFMDLLGKCRELGLPCFRGRYAGPTDLAGFRGIVHIPYAWSTFAFFESLQQGLVYFVPSLRFLREMARGPNFFWSPPYDQASLESSEWYLPEHRGLLVYFDSWEDLRNKALHGEHSELKDRISKWAQRHAANTIEQWGRVFG